MPRHEENTGPPIKLVFDISKTYPEISGFSLAADSVFLAHTHDQVEAKRLLLMLSPSLFFE